MNISRLFGLTIIALLAIHAGCADFDEDKDLCSAFCYAAAKCEWGDNGSNTLSSFYARQCINNCTFHLESGAYVVRRSTVCEEYDNAAGVCWKEVEQEQFLGNVGGLAVESYLLCLVNLDAWGCRDGGYEMLIESAEECSNYSECIDKLNADYIPTPQWNNGQCMDVSETNETVYLDLVL